MNYIYLSGPSLYIAISLPFFLWKYYLYSKGHLRKMDPNNTATCLYCFLLEKDSLLFDVVIKAIVDPFSM